MQANETSNIEAWWKRIRCREFHCILIALPRASWSRARMFDGLGPGPLRDDGAFLWVGLPVLSVGGPPGLVR